MIAIGGIALSVSRVERKSSSVCHASGIRSSEYRLIKRLWAWSDERIAVRFAYEWYDDSGNWFRSYGNWESDVDGLMRRRFACIDDLPISKSDR